MLSALNMIITVAFIMLVAWIAECAVLDPALYLVPSPPLMLARDSIPPGEMWGRSMEGNTERIARDVFETVGNEETITQTPVAVKGRMFWPRFSSPEPVLGIHIPLSLSLSGSYGKVASAPASVIANTYTSVAGLGTGISSTLGSGLGSNLFGKSVAGVYGNYGRAGLAGSSYGRYGTSAVRVYGSDNVAAWSGWGNSKWGHYGKG